ncbi:Box C/D snoRNA protein 1 [Mactra antiquata]
MKTCEVCSETVAKYRCPACEIETCCLKCVNQHKQQNDCDGQRDKTTYVSVNQFTDINLLSDYRFLEEGGRKTNNACRDNLKRKHNMPNFLKELEKQANKRNVKLRLMPYPMSRRKNNSTIYQHRLKKMLWQIEWIFPQSDHTIIDKRVNEDEILGSILKKHIGMDADPLIKYKLKCYTNTELNNLGIFLIQDKVDSPENRYYRLDENKSLSENFMNKNILEYPTIHVVLDDYWLNYPLVISEDQDDTETESESDVTTQPHPVIVDENTCQDIGDKNTISNQSITNETNINDRTVVDISSERCLT